MDNNYLNAAYRLRLTLMDIDKLLDKAPTKSFEDRKAYYALESVKERIEETISFIEHFSKPTKEGYLYQLENGKFTMDGINYNFSCGSKIEVYQNGEWYSGRVEHKDDHYYFYSNELEHPPLYPGMKVRVRI